MLLEINHIIGGVYNKCIDFKSLLCSTVLKYAAKLLDFIYRMNESTQKHAIT